jgi:hypothetical protein
VNVTVRGTNALEVIEAAIDSVIFVCVVRVEVLGAVPAVKRGVGEGSTEVRAGVVHNFGVAEWPRSINARRLSVHGHL